MLTSNVMGRSSVSHGVLDLKDRGRRVEPKLLAFVAGGVARGEAILAAVVVRRVMRSTYGPVPFGDAVGLDERGERRLAVLVEVTA
jgi:hypothetical protein